MKRAWIVLAVVLVLAVGCLTFWIRSNSRTEFPYSYSSEGLHLQPKETSLAMARQAVFEISAGPIEGEAIITPAHSEVEGDAVVESLAFGVTSAFQERPAPYGGQITALIACDSRKYVNEEKIEFAGRPARMVKAVASGRRVYGSCSAEEIRYASVFFAGFDPAKRLVVSVKLFQPVANVSEVALAQAAILEILRRVLGDSRQE